MTDALASIDILVHHWAWAAGFLFVADMVIIGLEIRWSRLSLPDRKPEAPLGAAVAPQQPTSYEPPWMTPTPDRELVDRPGITSQVVGLLRSNIGGTIGVTTALYGAGGFGKTTIAAMATASHEVVEAFPGGLLWVTLGEHLTPPQLAEKINDLSVQLGEPRPALSDPEQAGYKLAQLLDRRPPTLLVIDDVWEPGHLRSFLLGGSKCTRLVTTRKPSLLPEYAKTVRVDQMDPDEARDLLDVGTAGLAADTREALLSLTGRWPLLLAIVNGALRRAVRDQNSDLNLMASKIATRLAADGPASLDVRAESRRERAVRLTVSASLTLLSEQDRRRFLELGVFPEDVDISRETVAVLWRVNGAMDLEDVTRLCADFNELSLVQSYRGETGSMRLHDVLRAYVRNELGKEELRRLNGSFVDEIAGALPSWARSLGGWWWTLPGELDYYWRYLPYHLDEADRIGELSALVCDLRWLEFKIERYGVASAESDARKGRTSVAVLLARTLAREGHLFAPIEAPSGLLDTVTSRLAEIAELAPVVWSAPDRRVLVQRWPLPDVDIALARVLAGHKGWTTACAALGDEKSLLTVGRDGTARIWDVVDGMARNVLRAGGQPLACCAVSEDRLTLVTAGSESKAHVWSATSGRVLFELETHNGPVTGCAVSGDGRLIATASEDGKGRLWDGSARSLMRTVEGHRGALTDCALTADGTLLLTASQDSTARLWESTTGRLIRTFEGHEGAVVACAMSRDGEVVVTAGEDATVRRWSSDGRQLAVRSYEELAPTGCAISNDNNWIATSGWDGIVRLWSTEDLAPVATFGAQGIPTTDCAFAPDSRWIAATSWDGTVRVWETKAPNANILADNIGPTASCVFTRDGLRLVSANYDGSVRTWDIHGAFVSSVMGEGTSGALACALSMDGSELFVASVDGLVRRWSIATANLLGELTGHVGRVSSIALDERRNKIATAGDDGTVRIWDAATGRLQGVHTPGIGRLTACSFSGDGFLFVVGAADGSLALANVDSMDAWEKTAGHTDAVTSISPSHRSQSFVTSSIDGTVRLLDAASATSTTVIGAATTSIAGCAMSPDGHWAAVVDGNRILTVFSASDWNTRAAIRVDGDVHAVAWSPDSSTLAVSGHRGVYLLAFDASP